MPSRQDILATIKSQAVIPLFYHDDKEVCVQVLRTLYQSGFRTLEFTNRGKNGLTNFSALKGLAKNELPDLFLGIGTIRTPEDAQSFIDAGTDFIVCPVVNPEVAAVCNKADVFWIPGCLTPTEIDIAERSGATLVKIFPGSVVGPSYLSAIKEIFPKLLFMPTGGVEISDSSLHSWYNAGVIAVGMGSKLITKQILDSKEYSQLEASSKHLFKLIELVKK